MRTVSRRLLNIIFVGALVATSIDSASALVYRFERSLTGNISVSGIIETDDTLGAIEAANIVDWDIDINSIPFPGVTQTVNLLQSNSTIAFSDFASNLSATELELIWDFNGTGSFLIVDSLDQMNFWGVCGDPTAPLCSIANAEHASTIDVFNPGSAILSTVQYSNGPFVMAVAVIAEPATLTLFGMGIVVLGITCRRELSGYGDKS